MPEAVSAQASPTAGTVPHSDDDSSPDQTPPCQCSAVLLLPGQDPPVVVLLTCRLRLSSEGLAGQVRSSFLEERLKPVSKRSPRRQSFVVFCCFLALYTAGTGFPLSIARIHCGESVTLANMSASHQLSQACKD